MFAGENTRENEVGSKFVEEVILYCFYFTSIVNIQFNGSGDNNVLINGVSY